MFFVDGKKQNICNVRGTICKLARLAPWLLMLTHLYAKAILPEQNRGDLAERERSRFLEAIAKVVG